MRRWVGVASGSNMLSVEKPKQFYTSKILRKLLKKFAVNILAYSVPDFSTHAYMFMGHFT